jgi:uncharacterized protein YukE
MAKPDVRMNYETMESMASMFGANVTMFDQMKKDMQKIVQMLEGGALIGKGGSAFADAIQSQLIPSMEIMRDKLKEMQGDIKAAIRFTRDGVEDSRKQFF